MEANLTIQDLPVELIEKILCYLPAKSTKETISVCSQWYELNTSLWRYLTIDRWGENVLSLEDSNGILTNASLSKFFTAYKPIKPLKKDGSGEIGWRQYFSMRSSFEKLLDADTPLEIREFTPSNVSRALSAFGTAPGPRGHLIIDCLEYFALLDNEKLFNDVPKGLNGSTRSHVRRLLSLCKLLQPSSKYYRSVVLHTSIAFNQLPVQSLIASDVDLLKEIVRTMISVGALVHEGYFGAQTYSTTTEPILVFQTEAFDVVYEHMLAKDDVAFKAIQVLTILYQRRYDKFEEKSQKGWIKNMKIGFAHQENSIRDLITPIVEDALEKKRIVIDLLSDDELKLLLDIYFNKTHLDFPKILNIVRGVGPRAAKLMDETQITRMHEKFLKNSQYCINSDSSILYQCRIATEIGEFFGSRMKNLLPEYKQKILDLDKFVEKSLAMQVHKSYIQLGYYVIGDDFRSEAKEMIQTFMKQPEQEDFKNLCHFSGDLIVKTFENDTEISLKVILTLFEFLPDDFIQFGCSARSPIKYPELKPNPNWVPTDMFQFLKKIPGITTNQKTIQKARDLLESMEARRNREDIDYTNSYIEPVRRNEVPNKSENWKGWELSNAVSTLNKIAILFPATIAPYLQKLFHANLGIFREHWYSGLTRHSHELIWVYETIKPKLKLSDWQHYMNILTNVATNDLPIYSHLSQDFKYYAPEYQFITAMLFMIGRMNRDPIALKHENNLFRNLVLAWPGQVKFNIEQRADLSLGRIAAYCSTLFGIPLVVQKIDPKFIESLSNENFVALAESDMQRDAFIKACIINAAADLDSSVLGLHMFSPESMYDSLALAAKDPRFDTGIDEINQFAKNIDFNNFDFRFFGL